MPERYERSSTHFWIQDEELGIDLSSSLGEEEKGHFPSGELQFICYRKNQELHGPSTFYTPSKGILSLTWYVEGKKTGKAYRYYPDGQLYSLERFVEGVPHLAQEYYYIDGLLKSLISYKQGEFHGTTKLFWPDGLVKRETHFTEGKKEKGEKIYDEEGKLIETPVS